jgi:NAD-dependent deacetylase
MTLLGSHEIPVGEIQEIIILICVKKRKKRLKCKECFPLPTDYQTLLPEQCAEKLMKAGHVTVFSGAGISTAAGIPDFRGPNGLYTTQRYDPDRVFDIHYFKNHPELFYRFSQDFIQVLKHIEPTFTHQFVARLEKEGRLLGTITQNIDGLHYLAGSTRLAEVHGSYRAADCMNNPLHHLEGLNLSWWEKAMHTSDSSPVVNCGQCGGILKPDVVFFGEMVHEIDKAENWIAQCDLLLVLGSSLTVYPAALLPQFTRSEVIIINQGPVALTPTPRRYFIDDNLDHFFKKVVDFIDSRI